MDKGKYPFEMSFGIHLTTRAATVRFTSKRVYMYTYIDGTNFNFSTLLRALESLVDHPDVVAQYMCHFFPPSVCKEDSLRIGFQYTLAAVDEANTRIPC